MCFEQRPGFMKGTAPHITRHFYLFLPSDLQTQMGAPEVLRHWRRDEDTTMQTGLLLSLHSIILCPANMGSPAIALGNQF